MAQLSATNKNAGTPKVMPDNYQPPEAYTVPDIPTPVLDIQPLSLELDHTTPLHTHVNYHGKEEMHQ